MNAPTESRLLRLAISKGLLAWEDLDAVADRLPTPSGRHQPKRIWVQSPDRFPAGLDSGHAREPDG